MNYDHCEVRDLPGNPFPAVGYTPVAREWVVEEAFFRLNNIQPHWFNCHYTWGSVNKTTGLWSGGVGMIQRDEADYAIRGFGGTHARSKVLMMMMMMMIMMMIMIMIRWRASLQARFITPSSG